MLNKILLIFSIGFTTITCGQNPNKLKIIINGSNVNYKEGIKTDRNSTFHFSLDNQESLQLRLIIFKKATVQFDNIYNSEDELNSDRKLIKAIKKNKVSRLYVIFIDKNDDKNKININFGSSKIKCYKSIYYPIR